MNEIANKYKAAEKIVLNRMHDFQKKAVAECRTDPTRDDHIFQSFVKEMDILVECELNTNAPEYQFFLKNTYG